MFLAFAPWRSDDRATAFYAAFERGWLGSRVMVYPGVFFTNEAWPKPLPAGYIEREMNEQLQRQHGVAEKGTARGTKSTR